MKSTYLAMAVLGTAVATMAATPPTDFSGIWEFDAAQSKNVGMMGQAKITTTITQSKTEVIVDDASVFNGEAGQQHTVYDLEGKPTPNTLVMAGPATARSHWDGTRLVTEWESAGSIAGTTVKRTETRYLSADGRTMFVESSRAGREPMVMVFDREK
ncbi:hypothetical protein DYQ86_05105 [Acidobacteria bacterium AB60]|nr:hypothetical protein DYQ86_05105 [Acidobacteria bacterium AB60]